MQTFILALAIILISLAGLGLGLLFGRPALRGSCGGLSCVSGADCAGCPAHENREENHE